MNVVYPDPVDKKIRGKKYICHPGVIKKMLMNLQKMEYSSNESINLFYKQYELIYLTLWKEYYIKQNFFQDPSSFFIVQLLKFLKVDDCILEKTFASMIFEEYTYSDIIIKPWILLERLSTCNKILIPFIIQFSPTDAHANLLIIDVPTKKVYRVEPNVGFESYEKKYNVSIDNRLTHFATNLLGYTYAGYLPSSCQRMWHPGLCIFLSVIKYIYGKSLTNDQIKNTIVSFFKSEYNQICSKALKDT
jgi:hypothetical protein